jgi:rhodanese-related sulfurtransferase
MKKRFYTALSRTLLLGLFLGLMPVTLAAKEATEVDRSGWYKEIVDTEYVSQFAVIPPRDDVMIIDSRPSRKYDKGFVLTAVNIPDTQFDKLTDRLPEDKSTELIFYCGGFKCPLSHKSAFSAEALGYTNIKVYAEGYPAWVAKGNPPEISANHLKKLIDKGEKMTLVDARPARKFKKGAVPTAINISWTQFDQMTDQLPSDKGELLVFYCGGYQCVLSAKSAARAVEMGYTNVALFQAGYPAWKEAYGKSSASGLETGEEAGMLTIESFNRLLREEPDSVHLIDVRDQSEVDADGTFATARVLPVDQVEDEIDSLPDDKPLVFFCSTGARSGEAYDMVRMVRDDLKLYFLEAAVAFKKQEYPVVTPAE